MIHEVNGQFVVSWRGVWLPGAFDSRNAARCVEEYSIPYETLRDLRHKINIGESRAISLADLRGVLVFQPGEEWEFDHRFMGPKYMHEKAQRDRLAALNKPAKS